ncbi:MAG TPA: hypothetical protein VIW94_12695 [Acidimicrobiia bacterium]
MAAVGGRVPDRPEDESMGNELYEGPVRVFGDDGVLLTTGRVALEADEVHGNWTGVLETLANTGVAGKALVVTIETLDGRRGDAQLVPSGEEGDRAYSRVVGFGSMPPLRESSTPAPG